jgi:DNA invertase Pin-like site-specific DNA recombinase
MGFHNAKSSRCLDADRRAPGWRAIVRQAEEGDIVIAPKLDRLFRSALDALQVVEDLKKRGVSLHLLDLGGSRPFRL